jgi:hypothetical protein
MRPFRASLSVSPYPDGRTWWLNHPITYWRPGSSVHVPAFFETDFASVPSDLSEHLPALGYLRRAVDRPRLALLESAVRAQGRRPNVPRGDDRDHVEPWKRRLLYAAVRVFGWHAWRTNARIAAEGYSRIRTRASPVRPAWRNLR